MWVPPSAEPLISAATGHVSGTILFVASLLQQMFLYFIPSAAYEPTIKITRLSLKV